jgi:uncharacterized protein (TIGR02145 family)
MSILQQNGSLLKFASDKVKGFEIKRINAVSGIYVVDTKGYIGIKINDYFSQNGNPYPGNYALVAKGPDYQSLGLGQVTFIEVDSAIIGDKEYQVATMPDGKVWMCQNLDFVDTQGGIVVGSNARYYRNDEATYGWNGKKYGLLYNWNAAMSLTIAGWHLPSTTEWNELITACGGGSAANSKLASTTDWPNGYNGTDNYGFSIKPCGHMKSNSFYEIGTGNYIWTSTKTGSNPPAYVFRTTGDGFGISTYYTSLSCSIRLVKDSA